MLPGNNTTASILRTHTVAWAYPESHMTLLAEAEIARSHINESKTVETPARINCWRIISEVIHSETRGDPTLPLSATVVFVRSIEPEVQWACPKTVRIFTWFCDANSVFSRIPHKMPDNPPANPASSAKTKTLLWSIITSIPITKQHDCGV